MCWMGFAMYKKAIGHDYEPVAAKDEVRYDREPMIDVDGVWYFDWDNDVRVMLDAAYQTVSVLEASARTAETKSTWMGRVLQLYLETRPMHDQQYKHVGVSHNTTLNRAEPISIEMFEGVYNRVWQMLYDPNVYGRDARLLSWIEQHPEFSWSHLSDYAPVYRSPN